MISAIVKGRGFRGALGYVLNPAKASLLGGTFGSEVTSEGIAYELGSLRELNPRVKVPVFHGILSLDTGERLSDAVWIGVAQEYLERMGYTDTPFVVVRHTDTDNDHIHLIASRIRRDGSCVSDSNDWRRSEEICRAFEERLSLRRVASSAEVRGRRPTRGAQELGARTGEAPVHKRLQELIRRAAEGGPSLEVFVDRLALEGVSVALRRREDGTPYGISYGLDGVALRASDLGRSYTLGGLAREHGLSWGAGGAIRPPNSFPRETILGLGSGSAWSSAAVGELGLRMRRLPGFRREAAEARNALFVEGVGALRGLLSAPYLAQRLTSPKLLVRGLLRRLPGGRSLDLALALTGAFHSPVAALSFAARLAGYLGGSRAVAVEREVVRLYARAAASDRPDLATFGRRLAEVGIGLRQDRQNLVYSLQGTTWTSRELGGLATLRGLNLKGFPHAEDRRAHPRRAAARDPGDAVLEPPGARGDGARAPAPPRRDAVDPRGHLGPRPLDPGGDGGDRAGSDRAAPLRPAQPPPASARPGVAHGGAPLPGNERRALPEPGGPPARGLPSLAPARRPLPGKPSSGALSEAPAGGAAGADSASLLRRELGVQIALSGGRIDLRIEEPGARPVALSGVRRADLSEELLERLAAANRRGANILFRPVHPSLQILRSVPVEALRSATDAGFGPALILQSEPGRAEVVLRHPPGAPQELRPFLRRAVRLSYDLPAEGTGRPFLPAGGFLFGPAGARNRTEITGTAGATYARGPALLGELRRQHTAAQEALSEALGRLGLPSMEAFRRLRPELGRRALHAAWARQALERGLGVESVVHALSAAAGGSQASHLRFALKALLELSGERVARRLVSQALPLPARVLALAVGSLGKGLRLTR